MTQSELFHIVEEETFIGNVVERVFRTGTSMLNWDAQIEALCLENYTYPRFSLEREYPEGSLLRCYKDYMNHNGFSENFFPFHAPQGCDLRAVYAARQMNFFHDYIHAICGYESSDEDEFRLESFTLGQNPFAFSVFFKGCFADGDINQAKFKHLRDVWRAPVFMEDLLRGSEAVSVLSLRLENVAFRDLNQLRSELNIAPRVSPVREGNTCGLRTSEKFFA